MKSIYSHILFLILAISNALSINAAVLIPSNDYYESIYQVELTNNYKSIYHYEKGIINSIIQSENNKHYKYKNSFSDYDIHVKGKIKVNDDDTGILSISPGGSLKVSKKTFGNRRAVIIESNSKGELNYEYYEGRTQIDYIPEGEKWLADVLLDVIRITGIDAEGRVKRIYTKDGVDAVLDEITMITSNSVSVIYFEALLDNHKLNDEENMAVTTAISRLSSNTSRGDLYSTYSSLFLYNAKTSVIFFSNLSKLSSNSEKARVLTHITKKIDFENEDVIEAYFAVIDRMTSNTERGRVLRNLENEQELSDDTYVRLLQSVGKFTSNTEMGSTIRSMDNMDVSNPDISEAYFNTIDKMSSNTEKGSTLRHLIKNQDLSINNYARMLGSIKKMSSNTEMGSVLRSFPAMEMTDSTLVEPYFLAIKSMSSNSETGSVLRDAIDKYKMNNYVWTNLFSTTARMTSNTEMGNVLSVATTKMPFNSTVLDAFFLTVNKLTSNTEIGSVLGKVIKSDKFNKYACLGVLNSCMKMTSNSEIALTLKKVAETEWIKDEEVKSKYIQVAKSMTSDSYYREVIDLLI